jgi:predicted HNH restriction endonuclease
MPIHETKHCKRCDTEKTSDEFYRRRKGKDLSPYCKSCSNQVTVERQRKFKRKCIDYKGGKCEVCGYDKCESALEFHHREPEQKDFSVSKSRLTSFSDKVTAELDKCALLCANCHREVHSGLVTLSNQ